MKIFHNIIFILGLLALIYSFLNILSFPRNAGGYFVGILGAFFIFISIFDSKYEEYKHIKMVRILKIMIKVTSIYLILTFLIMCIAIFFVSRSTLNKKYDSMIILGAGINGNKVSKMLQYRLDAAYDYYEKNKDIIIVVSGGQGYNEIRTEASVMKEYLIYKGISDKQILLEDKSTSTIENIENSKKILDENIKDGYNTLIVTNDFHTVRSSIYAKMLRVDFGILSSKTRISQIPSCYIREYMAFYKMVLINMV